MEPGDEHGDLDYTESEPGGSGPWSGGDHIDFVESKASNGRAPVCYQHRLMDYEPPMSRRDVIHCWIAVIVGAVVIAGMIVLGAKVS